MMIKTDPDEKIGTSLFLDFLIGYVSLLLEEKTWQI